MRRGWVMLLAVFLMVWEPMRIAAEFQSSMGTLSTRGSWAVAELLLHAAIAAFCVASGWALWNGNVMAPQFATYALVASATVTAQSLFWSLLPHQTVPGERLPFAIAAVVHAAGWILYLKRSRRVRAIYN